MRLDKWLWAARFFKTRSLAQQAVAGGRVQLNGERTKRAHEVKPGDSIDVRVGEWRWEVVVRALSDRRGPAQEARKLYEETRASRAERERRQESQYREARYCARFAMSSSDSVRATLVMLPASLVRVRFLKSRSCLTTYS